MHRNILIPRNIPPSIFILVNDKPTQKDKLLPVALFLPSDFVYLRCVFSFLPVVDQRQEWAMPGAVVFT